MSQEALLPAMLPKAEERGGYINYVTAAFGHALLMMLRRQRIILASAICLMPVLLPLAIAYLGTGQFASSGVEIFAQLAQSLHVLVLAPLLALFFATMLVGEDAESQTMAYVLTRPTPRSAWVFGRFLAYLLVAYAILCVSLTMTFGASTILKGLGFGVSDLKLLLNYLVVIFFALLGYGAVTVFLGAVTKRPIVWGVLLLYFWQSIASWVTGLVDYATIRKYVEDMMPSEMRISANLSEERLKVLEELSATHSKEAVQAGCTLLCITAVLLGLTVLTVRVRQYAAAKAAGA